MRLENFLFPSNGFQVDVWILLYSAEGGEGVQIPKETFPESATHSLVARRRQERGRRAGEERTFSNASFFTEGTRSIRLV